MAERQQRLRDEIVQVVTQAVTTAANAAADRVAAETLRVREVVEREVESHEQRDVERFDQVHAESRERGEQLRDISEDLKSLKKDVKSLLETRSFTRGMMKMAMILAGAISTVISVVFAYFWRRP